MARVDMTLRADPADLGAARTALARAEVAMHQLDDAQALALLDALPAPESITIAGDPFFASLEEAELLLPIKPSPEFAAWLDQLAQATGFNSITVSGWPQLMPPEGAA